MKYAVDKSFIVTLTREEVSRIQQALAHLGEKYSASDYRRNQTHNLEFEFRTMINGKD